MTRDDLQARLNALPEPEDVPLSWTPRMLEQLAMHRSELVGRLHTINVYQRELATTQAEVTRLTEWRNHLVRWQTTLEAELARQPQFPRTVQEVATREKLQFSLQRVLHGLDLSPTSDCLYANLPLDDLMRNAGFVPRDLVDRANGGAWFGALDYVDDRLKEYTARRDDAKYRLDAAFRDDLATTAPTTPPARPVEHSTEEYMRKRSQPRAQPRSVKRM